jgi:hypothetical protein
LETFRTAATLDHSEALHLFALLLSLLFRLPLVIQKQNAGLPTTILSYSMITAEIDVLDLELTSMKVVIEVFE